MTKVGMILDFSEMMVTVFGVRRAMMETTIGHPIISVLPTRKADPFQCEILMTESEERSITDNPGKTWKMTVQEQKAAIHKVHKQAGHPSKAKMLGMLRNSSINWDKKVLKAEVDWFAKNCEGCILKRTPCKPAAQPVSRQPMVSTKWLG